MSWIEDAGEEFEGLDMTTLRVDEAYLRLHTDINVWLYLLSDDCYKCPYSRSINVGSQGDAVLALNVAHPQRLRITNGDLGSTHPTDDFENVLCDVDPNMGEFGVYDLNILNRTCRFTVAKDPVNIYLPILLILIALLGFYVLCNFGRLLLKKLSKKSEGNDVTASTQSRKRIKSLDSFRGMSIVLMIFVNDGAGRYWWMEHATWNGLTVGDLVFPFFLWIMGVCIPISVKSIISKNTPKYITLSQILKRSCTLFLIGMALGSIFTTDIKQLRMFGVLQRFGVSYFLVASLVLICTKRNTGDVKHKFHKMFKDITDLGVEWVIIILLVIIHLLITFLVAAPGCPTGYIGPGGMHVNWLYTNCIGGITKYIDVQALGETHIFQNPTAKFVYDSGSFDPEGLFGCILSVVHVFFGVQAGYTLLHHVEWKPVIIRWLLWAAVTGIVGGALCGWSKEDGIIPVNKNLWSLSYVMVTTCFSFIVLSIFYLLIDVFEWWDGSPFIQPGMNAIVMYIGHMMCYSIFPFHWSFQGMRTHFLFMVEAAWGTFLWIVVAYVLAKKKIFITV